MTDVLVGIFLILFLLQWFAMWTAGKASDKRNDKLIKENNEARTWIKQTLTEIKVLVKDGDNAE